MVAWDAAVRCDGEHGGRRGLGLCPGAGCPWAADPDSGLPTLDNGTTLTRGRALTNLPRRGRLPRRRRVPILGWVIGLGTWLDTADYVAPTSPPSTTAMCARQRMRCHTNGPATAETHSNPPDVSTSRHKRAVSSRPVSAKRDSSKKYVPQTSSCLVANPMRWL